MARSHNLNFRIFPLAVLGTAEEAGVEDVFRDYDKKYVCLFFSCPNWDDRKSNSQCQLLRASVSSFPTFLGVLQCYWVRARKRKEGRNDRTKAFVTCEDGVTWMGNCGVLERGSDGLRFRLLSETRVLCGV
jgi:hypothetical protein